jgi:hypothetical protein
MDVESGGVMRELDNLSLMVLSQAGEDWKLAAYVSTPRVRQVEERGAAPDIPPKANRKWKTASRPFCIGTETPLSVCSAASRISGAWRRAMIETPPISSPVCYWL